MVEVVKNGVKMNKFLHLEWMLFFVCIVFAIVAPMQIWLVGWMDGWLVGLVS